MPAHAWWRLEVTASNNGSGYVTNYEIEMRATPGGADQCAGGTPFGTPGDFGLGPANAFDNNNSTSHFMIPPKANFYTGYQFAAPVDVEELGYYVALTSDSPSDFELAYSDDGVAYTVYKTYSNKTPTAWTGNAMNTPVPDAPPPGGGSSATSQPVMGVVAT